MWLFVINNRWMIIDIYFRIKRSHTQSHKNQFRENLLYYYMYYNTKRTNSHFVVEEIWIFSRFLVKSRVRPSLPNTMIIYTSRPMFVRWRRAEMKIYILCYHVPVKRPFDHRLFRLWRQRETGIFLDKASPSHLFLIPLLTALPLLADFFFFLHIYSEQERYVVLRTCRERGDVDSASRLPDARKLKCHGDFCCDVPLEQPCRTKRRYSVWCTIQEWSLKTREKRFTLNSSSLNKSLNIHKYIVNFVTSPLYKIFTTFPLGSYEMIDIISCELIGT